ncbi:MAG: arsenate reductase family protein [Campylobacteraceae bacterium]
MTKIYGIKTCGSVVKAFNFFKAHDLAYEFVDFKATPVDEKKIKEWLQLTDLATLLNTKGTKYKTLKLKDLNLDNGAKVEWLSKENLLIKRPVIEFNKKLIVGYDEERYKKEFL